MMPSAKVFFFRKIKIFFAEGLEKTFGKDFFKKNISLLRAGSRQRNR